MMCAVILCMGDMVETVPASPPALQRMALELCPLGCKEKRPATIHDAGCFAGDPGIGSFDRMRVCVGSQMMSVMLAAVEEHEQRMLGFVHGGCCTGGCAWRRKRQERPCTRWGGEWGTRIRVLAEVPLMHIC